MFEKYNGKRQRNEHRGFTYVVFQSHKQGYSVIAIFLFYLSFHGSLKNKLEAEKLLNGSRIRKTVEVVQMKDDGSKTNIIVGKIERKTHVKYHWKAILEVMLQ